MATKGDNLKHMATKTADAPLPSNHTTLDKAESNDGQDVCHTPATDVMNLVKDAQYFGDGLQSVSDLKQADLASQSERYAYVGCETADVGGKVIAKDEVLLTVSKEDQENDRRTTRVLSSECCSQQVESIGIKNARQSKLSDTEGVPFDRPMSNDVVEVPGPSSAEGHTVIIEDECEHGKENSPDSRCTRDSLIESSSICKIEVETALPTRDAEISTKPPEGLSASLDTSNRENTGKAALSTPCFPARNSGACGESANKNNRNCGVAVSSQEDIEMGNSLNDLELHWALSLSPKAVMQALGQLRFWKARLALIRQQRIFSDQVFELHKLIEVQRLLAGTPYTSIDDIYFGVGNMNLECDAFALASHRGLVDKKENVRDALGKKFVVPKQVVREAKTKSRVHLEQCPAVPDVVEGGGSAWYPGLGVGQCTGSLPAAGAFPYPPLGGSFTPGSAVDGPFAAPVLGPEGAAMIRSPIFPFNFPFFSQKPHLTPGVQSSYGYAIASSNQEHPAPYCKSSGHKVSSHSGPSTLKKMYWEAEGPTTTLASISGQPDTSQQRVKVAYPSSFNSHEEEVQPGREGLTVSGSTPEDIQHTVMGLKANFSTARPANKLRQYSEHNEQGPSQASHLKHLDYDAEKMGSLIKEVRGCKRQKERKQQDSLATGKDVDVNNSLNPSVGALKLFPLAPTLSLDEHSKGRPLAGVKELQGHVIKVVPRPAISTPESAAGILLSIQQERKPQLVDDTNIDSREKPQ